MKGRPGRGKQIRRLHTDRGLSIGDGIEGTSCSVDGSLNGTIAGVNDVFVGTSPLLLLFRNVRLTGSCFKSVASTNRNLFLISNLLLGQRLNADDSNQEHEPSTHGQGKSVCTFVSAMRIGLQRQTNFPHKFLA